jgi:uncharacterized protein (DUF2384 family)
MEDIRKIGLEVFDTDSRLDEWMNSNIQSLGVTPISLCDTDYGRDLVLSTLGKILYGVY